MHKVKQQLRKELIASKNSYQDFHDGNIVKDFGQYMRTGQ